MFSNLLKACQWRVFILKKMYTEPKIFWKTGNVWQRFYDGHWYVFSVARFYVVTNFILKGIDTTLKFGSHCHELLSKAEKWDILFLLEIFFHVCMEELKKIAYFIKWLTIILK